ncbi:ABC transporter ATP-binding protein [Microbacterium sp. No. 7]|uniref:ABC transporter ATP-binding protein n=1 Tax=Microbacterium sp. No. 7 TaxID=1714373 RepID=UPI0006D0C5A1|nr:ATP-binding cassette domain-containing protein [Microbacterium sp. No. 7]ALJ19382.1 ABC transporter ATP-binding protein [Microbacterium sp. No. 7]
MLTTFSTVRRVLAVMPPGASRFYTIFVIASSSLAILDMVSMGLLALVLTPVLTGSEIVLPVLGAFPPESAGWFVLLACGLIIVKAFLAIALQWQVTRRFARYELAVGDQLLTAYTELNWDSRTAMSTSDVTRIADSGIANTIMGFLLPLASLPGNVLSFVAVAVVLFISQPAGALAVTAYLVIVALVLLLIVSRKTMQAGRVNRDYAYRAASVITEIVLALKELTLRDALPRARAHVRELRSHAVRGRANISFLAVVPKHVIEAALVGGLLIVGGVALMVGGIHDAVVAVALFTATGFRMVPALTSIQTSLTSASANLVYARNVIDDIASFRTATNDRGPVQDVELPARPRLLRLSGVGYRYPGADRDALTDISLDLPIGGSLGVVGPTGAGKSTLIDVLLGLYPPTSGTVEIDGVAIENAQRAYRRLVAYVPQHVTFLSGTFAQNVALTWDDDYDAERVESALRRASLGDLLDTLPHGIHSRIEEGGSNLSGGQRQRIGIARALYSEPLILVMDEATSALDVRTEEDVTRAIAALRGDVSVIAIAHRLSTIRDLDEICYMADGRIVGRGAFDDLRRQLPEFDDHVRLAGLAEREG